MELSLVSFPQTISKNIYVSKDGSLQRITTENSDFVTTLTLRVGKWSKTWVFGRKDAN